MQPGHKPVFDTFNPLLEYGPASVDGGIIGEAGDEIPVELAPPLDLGNKLMKHLPVTVLLEAGSMVTREGNPMGILTWYSYGTTQTVFLTPAELEQWATTLAKLASLTTGSRKAALIICTATTRFTALLTPEEIRGQSQIVSGLSSTMRPSGLITAPKGMVLPPGPDGHRRLNLAGVS